VYVDGSDVTDQPDLQADFANTALLQLGRFTNSGFFFRGTLDEARVETAARSADWVRATWQNMSPGSGFQSYSLIDRLSPVLRVALNPAGLALTWPASGVGLSLYSATNLAPPISWTLVPQIPALIGSSFVVRVPIDATAHYFCLR
jgi:hypothetical protein